MTNLAIRLAEAGRRAEVLTLVGEASTCCRELARTDTDVFGPTTEQADRLVTTLVESKQ